MGNKQKESEKEDVGIPKINPGFDDLLGLLNRTQHVVGFASLVYYSKRTQSKISKEKRHMRRSLEETR